MELYIRNRHTSSYILNLKLSSLKQLAASTTRVLFFFLPIKVVAMLVILFTTCAGAQLNLRSLQLGKASFY